MASGILKLWNADRGYGFIADSAGGPDVFLHITALQSAGIDPDNLRKGDRLTFEVEIRGMERPRPATFTGQAEGGREMHAGAA